MSLFSTFADPTTNLLPLDGEAFYHHSIFPIEEAMVRTDGTLQKALNEEYPQNLSW